jgi:hypothetical protein
MNSRDRVFISYASADVNIARKIVDWKYLKHKRIELDIFRYVNISIF